MTGQKTTQEGRNGDGGAADKPKKGQPHRSASPQVMSAPGLAGADGRAQAPGQPDHLGVPRTARSGGVSPPLTGAGAAQRPLFLPPGRPEMMLGVGVRQPRRGDARHIPRGHAGDSAHHLIHPAIICRYVHPVLPLRKADPANNAGLLRSVRAKIPQIFKKPSTAWLSDWTKCIANTQHRWV